MIGMVEATRDGVILTREERGVVVEKRLFTYSDIRALSECAAAYLESLMPADVPPEPERPAPPPAAQAATVPETPEAIAHATATAAQARLAYPKDGPRGPDEP